MKFKALTPLAITVLIIAFIFGVFLLTADRQYNDASQDYIYTPSLEVRYDTIYIYGFKDASKIYIAPDNSDDAEVIKLNAVEIVIVDELIKNTRYDYIPSQSGDFSVYLEYENSEKNTILHTTMGNADGEYTIDGMVFTISLNENVKELYSAEGEYSSYNLFLNSSEYLSYNKYFDRTKDSYSFTFKKAGIYTIFVLYNDNQLNKYVVTAGNKEKGTVVNGNTLTLSTVIENWDKIRWVKGILTEASQFKQTEGNRCFRFDYITVNSDGTYSTDYGDIKIKSLTEIEFTNLSGTYSFLIEYDDGGRQIETFTF